MEGQEDVAGRVSSQSLSPSNTSVFIAPLAVFLFVSYSLLHLLLCFPPQRTRLQIVKLITIQQCIGIYCPVRGGTIHDYLDQYFLYI